MKISEKWLREWVNPSANVQALGDKLTDLGLELESITPDQHDQVIELGITPNRGDCFSVLGIARELSVGFHLPLQGPVFDKINPTLNETKSMTIQVPAVCPRYCGRVIRGVKGGAPTPDWMKDRLEKSGMQSVNILADITNYVMLELGQPMHVFDLNALRGDLEIRISQGESLTLLNDLPVTLDDDTVVICDEEGVVALGGIMGGLRTAVSTDTTDVFLESAFFAPQAMMGRARRLGLFTEGAQRFERGVDPQLSPRAMERATQLIVELAGGQASVVQEVLHPEHLPLNPKVELSHQTLCELLGMDLSSDEVLKYLQALNMESAYQNGRYEVKAPSYRFDINIPEDLIEEVIRNVGYDNIPETRLPTVPAPTPSECSIPVSRLKSLLIDRGYHEVITYSFVDKEWQEVLFPQEPTHDLLNPISPDMGSMRLSIWPGLLKTLAYNQNRQLNDLRIFETGQCFKGETHTEKLAGLISGQAHPLNWSLTKRPVDFFDIKGDVEALLAQTLDDSYYFLPDTHSALAPGQTAAIMRGDECVGWVGAVHPAIANQLGFKLPAFVFEINLDNLLTRSLPAYQPLSKFPAIRRDLALLVDAKVPAAALLQVAQEKAGPLLRQIDIFDVYQGERIENGKKSIALGLILQDSSRTLIDKEVNDVMQAVVQGLEQAFDATVRE